MLFALEAWGYGERGRVESLSEDDYLIKRDFKGVLPAKPWSREAETDREGETIKHN